LEFSSACTVIVNVVAANNKHVIIADGDDCLNNCQYAPISKQESQSSLANIMD
jgi:hypothetical protein